ncbi:hypothetical protein RSOLAG22IIIB_11352 [Rhizoctonia solani]|uniref:Uncharacterized protein n=1 Tax=Rhizoctonia solani TaxID=456999 RepID=A0A0K6G7P1_9AGAM|nr:hypothetical protein RSOLAG22IIIB_11352 [Rhizoctonia solani]
MHDLKSREGVLAYLEGTRFAAADVQLLSGGLSAFTYRVILKVPLDTGEKTVVIKHFEGYLAGREPTKWGAERADHEYKALSAIAASGLFDSNSVVQLPWPLEYDQETHTIFMTDLGSPIPVTQVLEKGFPDVQPSEPFGPNEMDKLARRIGEAVGDFVGRFHNWSALPEQSTLRSYFALNPAVVQRPVEIHYFCLQGQQEALVDGGALVMGDCSLHNILVSPPSEHRDMRIYLTDLETTRASYPELDIGGLTASVVSFSRICCPSVEEPFLSTLHQAYTRYCCLDPRRIGVATGVDLMGFSTYLLWDRYKSETKLRDVAAEGFKILSASFKGDEHSIKTNPALMHLFPSSQQLV